MRSFKFRAWNGNEMIGPLNPFEDLNHAPGYGDSCNGNYWDEDENVSYWGRKRIWMQYTGLKDKNGKEIYEGDICEANIEYRPAFRGAIEFKQGSFYIRHNSPARDDDAGLLFVIPDIEVIGNIYESPELLQEKTP